MKKYEYLLFDLDGTVADNSEGVCKSFEYALNYYGIKVGSLEELSPVIGPPLKDSFMDFYSFSEEKAIEAVAKYRERYKDVGIFECLIYPGIDTLLGELKSRGYKIVLATSKPETFARRILDHFDLSKHFYFIAGAEIGGKISNKEDVLEHIIKSLNITDVKECLMIGDRKFDLIGADCFGMDAMGVLYGFGDMEELSAYPNVGIAETVEDIGRLLP